MQNSNQNNLNIFDINIYDFTYPSELVALKPLKNREEAKLLLVDKNNKKITHLTIKDFPNLLQDNDLIVRNDTKVFKSRIFGKKDKTLGKVEVLLNELTDQDNNIWKALIQTNRSIHEGQKILFNDKLEAIIIKKNFEFTPTPLHLIKFNYDIKKFHEYLEKYGLVPLPPYIKREASKEDEINYQTIYAKKEGSTAAPTAGFHITENIINQIKNKKIPIIDVTLHIGPGTFIPIKTQNIKEHPMHEETFIVSKEAYDQIVNREKNNMPITCIGTTSLRVVETISTYNILQGKTNLYIYPGYQFKNKIKLLTNFHRPRSTLFVLICTLIGDIDFTKYCYNEAFKNKYRLFSFGDAMFII